MKECLVCELIKDIPTKNSNSTQRDVEKITLSKVNGNQLMVSVNS